MLEQEGIVVSLMPAAQLQIAFKLIREYDFSEIQLFELGRLFRRGIVDEDVLRKCFAFPKS